MSFHLSKAARLCSLKSSCLLGVKSSTATSGVYKQLYRYVSDDSAGTSVVSETANLTPVEAVQVVDPPFYELGLGTGWMPYDAVELGFEALHNGFGLPWWGTITLGAVIVRIFTFPLFVNSRKFNIRMSNHGQETQKLMNDLSDANLKGNFMDKALASKAYFAHMKETRTGMMYAYPTLLMGATFTSCFFALRHMVNLPLPSLEASSFLWLESLTDSDPYRVLPLITGSVVGLGIHLGFKLGTPIPGNYANVMKYVPALPVVLMPLFFGHMSGALQLFMMINSSITSLASVICMLPQVQSTLNFPERIVRPQPVAQVEDGKKKKGKAGGSIKDWFQDTMKDNRSKARVRVEVRTNKRRLKDEEKRRAKELRGQPPTTYQIGSQAVLTSVPDFKKSATAAVVDKAHLVDGQTKAPKVERTIVLPPVYERF